MKRGRNVLYIYTLKLSKSLHFYQLTLRTIGIFTMFASLSLEKCIVEAVGCMKTTFKGTYTVYVKINERWFIEFKIDDLSLVDKSRERLENAIDDNGLREIIENNPRQTLRKIIFQMIPSHSRIIRHLLQIGRKMDKWVPHEFSNMQKPRWMETATSE